MNLVIALLAATLLGRLGDDTKPQLAREPSKHERVPNPAYVPRSGDKAQLWFVNEQTDVVVNSVAFASEAAQSVYFDELKESSKSKDTASLNAISRRLMASEQLIVLSPGTAVRVLEIEAILDRDGIPFLFLSSSGRADL